MNKLCFIVPYFGEFPWWMVFFLRSIENNPTYSWLIVSDRMPREKLPPNVHLKQVSLEDFRNNIAHKLSLEIQLAHPYKVCDFKPALGEIFSEFLKDYEYWGYCDLDLIFGDLDSFIKIPMASGYDVISPDEDFFPGHFCIFRNNEKINSLYKTTDTYLKIFNSNRIYFFDEFFYPGGIDLSENRLKNVVDRKINRHKRLTNLKTSKIFRIIRPLFKILFRKTDMSYTKITDFNSAIRAAVFSGDLNVFCQSMYDSDVNLYCNNLSKWKVEWENGKLFRDKEILYFHFQMAKSNPQFRIKTDDSGFQLILE